MTTALPPTITDATITLPFATYIPGVTAGHYYGYCKIDFVRTLYPAISEQSQLTNDATGNTRIATEIFGAAVEIQDELDHYYAMPYSGTSDVILSTLMEMNAKLAVARLLDRMYVGQEGGRSEIAGHYRQHVTDLYFSIRNGSIRWDTPWGDATARAQLPVYDLSTASTISPNPNDLSDPGSVPKFQMGGRTAFSREGIM